MEANDPARVSGDGSQSEGHGDSEHGQPMYVSVGFPLVPEGIACVSCGDSLFGQPFDGQCRQCGKRIGESIPSVTIEPESPGSMKLVAMVRDSTACVSCCYDLAGLELNSPCPECARPILDSLRPFTLRHAPVEHIKTLHRGSLLLEIGVISYIVFCLLSMCVMPFVISMMMFGGGAGGGGGGGMGGYWVLQLVSAPITLGILGVTGVGIWQLTTPLPGLERVGRFRSRMVVRTSMIVVGCAMVLAMIFQFFMPPPAWPGGGFGPGGVPAGGIAPGVASTASVLLLSLNILFSIVGTIALLVLVVSLWYFIRAIAAVIPSRLIQRRARNIRGVFLATVLVVLLSFGIAFLSVMLAQAAPGGVFTIVMFSVCGLYAIGGILGIVLFVMTIGLLDALRKELSAARAQAEFNSSLPCWSQRNDPEDGLRF